jgi:hypothetical protein
MTSPEISTAREEDWTGLGEVEIEYPDCAI